MWSWKVLRPKATPNWIVNPSFEVGAAGWTLGTGAAVSTTQAYRGCYSLAFSGSQPTSGLVATQALTVANASNSCYLAGRLYVPAASPAIAVRLVKTSDSTVLATASADLTKTGQWQRVSVLCSAVGITNTAVTVQLYVAGSVPATLYFDAAILENGSTGSTYFDGDTPGCVWRGKPHYSQSYRPVDCRSGGVEVPLANYMAPQSMQGWGKAQYSNVGLPFGLQGGEVYQRTIKQARTASIVGNVGTNLSPANYGLDYIHDMQADMGQLLGDLSRPQNPARLIYSSGETNGKDLEVSALYEAGLDFNDLQGLTSNVPLRFHCPDPFLYERQEQHATIGGTSTSASATSFYRRPGEGFKEASTIGPWCTCWVNPPTGGTKLWLGLSTGIHRLAFFDPATMTTTDPTVEHTGDFGPTDGNVYAMVQTGNYVWIGGTFAHFEDSAGVHAYGPLVRYNLVTGMADANWTTAAKYVLSLAYEPSSDSLYVGCSIVSGGDYKLMGLITAASSASPAGITTTNVPQPYVPTPGASTGCFGLCVSNGNVYAETEASGAAYISGGATSITTTLPMLALFYTPALIGLNSNTLTTGPDGALYLAGYFDPIFGTGFPPLTNSPLFDATTAPIDIDSIDHPLGTARVNIPLTPGIAVGDYVQVAGTSTSPTTNGIWKVDTVETTTTETLVTLHGGGSVTAGAVGTLQHYGTVQAHGLARYNGTSWAAFGGLTGVSFGASIAWGPDGRAHITGLFGGSYPDSLPVDGSPDNRVTWLGATYIVYDGSSSHVEGLAWTYTTPPGNWQYTMSAVNPWDGSVFVYTCSVHGDCYLSSPATVSYTGTAPTSPRLIFRQDASVSGRLGGIRNERTGQGIYFVNLLLAAGETLYVDTTPGAEQVYTDLRGDVSAYVSPLSDLSNFVLLPGDNYLHALYVGGTPQLCAAVWYPAHDSIDGAGSSVETLSLEAL